MFSFRGILATDQFSDPSKQSTRDKQSKIVRTDRRSVIIDRDMITQQAGTPARETTEQGLVASEVNNYYVL
jgi:hypothetical protein